MSKVYGAQHFLRLFGMAPLLLVLIYCFTFKYHKFTDKVLASHTSKSLLYVMGQILLITKIISLKFFNVVCNKSHCFCTTEAIIDQQHKQNIYAG